MLATGALQHLGLVPDPVTKKSEPNLLLAKHTIDTLGILSEKTKGNLSADEEELLGGLLHDLRLKYLAALERGATPPEANGSRKKGEK